MKSELYVLYRRTEFRNCSSIHALFEVINDTNLSDTYSECVTLMKVVITIPLTSAEAERSFSTLKRIKTFLRNTMCESRLNALAMLSIEKKMIRSMVNFNTLVIERFANQVNRRGKFVYY